MAVDYTTRWNNFQFRSPVYIDGHTEPYRFNLVKWETRETFEAIDGNTGENKLSSEYCYVIGQLIWDAKEKGFDFESLGLRYLEHRTEGLEEWILAFAKMKEIEFSYLE